MKGTIPAFYYNRAGLLGQGVWDDLRFPVGNLTVPAASRPDSEAGTGMLLFDAASTEFVFGLAQLPHTWFEGSAIRPHLHWTPTTTGSGNVLWRLEYQIRNAENDVAFDFSTGWTVANLLAPASGINSKAQINSFGPVTMTGYLISCLIHFKLSRIGGDASDTYAADARLLELDFHYQIDSPGSLGIFTKR